MTEPRQRPLRQRPNQGLDVIDHIDDDDDDDNQDPNDFLDRAHPENDDYMVAIERIQRKIMHASSLLRTKQVNIIKSVFSGQSYVEAAFNNQCHPITASKVAHSTNGQRLLSLLQYHLKLLEGPNEALRRNMLWRIAVKEETPNPKTSITAIEALNKMHFQNHQIKNPDAGGKNQPTQVTIVINQELMPKGALDK